MTRDVPAHIEPTGWTGYLAPSGFETELRQELGDAAATYDRLMFASGPPRPAAWAQNVWHDPVRIQFDSINEAAKALRAMGRNWALYASRLHRRAALIQEALPHFEPKPLVFPSPLPKAPVGSWTLADASTLIAAPRCQSPFRHGELSFVEDRERPPNRAYLKLWEVFTLLQSMPKPGEQCVDLGASPGGWSWVLHELGARVIAVDKAPLAPRVASFPRVTFRRESAFGLDPRAVGPIDWLFSDVVCYPARLLALVRRWLEAGTCQRFVFTVKFQGPTDHETARAFAAIPGSRLMHLSHNKHELTWVRL